MDRLPARSMVPSHGEARSATSKRWVLVVDDDEAVRGAMVHLLAQEPDIGAISAESAARALQVLRGIRVDAVVVDLAMPGMNGLDLVEVLRGHPATSNVPVVVVTALPPDALPRRVAAAAHPLVAKPFEAEELVATVRGVLVQRPAAGPDPA